VELLVVIAIIGVLVALLLPAIQAAREAARRTQCNNNVKNIGLALQNYHDSYKVFPMGATPARVGATGGPVLGPSWWYGILPFIEQRNIYDKIAATQRAGATAPIFAAGAMDGAITGTPITQLVPEVMRCPSSPLPVMATQTGPICLPSYVGIAGGVDILVTSGGRAYTNQNVGTAPNNSAVVTSSGMLPPCQHINMAGCTDGTSNTAIVSEQSDWLRDTDTTVSTAFHGDPGWNDDTAAMGGWISGMAEPIIQVGGTTWATTGGMFNITTVRYGADLKRVLGTGALPGCDAVRGHNNPLQSPHPGGINVGFVDGSVQFISGTQQLHILLRIAIRDDGQVVNLDN
jgi:prepilin-type processing-associated H-X9-DG protein